MKLARISRFAPLAAGAAFAAVTLSLSHPVYAQTNLLTNGSFENGNFTGDSSGTQVLQGGTAITGWTALVTNGNTNVSDIAWLGNDNPYVGAASDGIRALDLTGYDDTTPFGGITQTLTLTQGKTYTLSFDIGSYQSNSHYSGPVSVEAKAGNLDQIFTFAASTGSTGQQWQTETAIFTATSATTTLSFQGISSGGGQYIGLDNAVIKTTASAPEPGSAALLALAGMPVLAAFARRRRACPL